jgi:hypothetical protein
MAALSSTNVMRSLIPELSSDCLVVHMLINNFFLVKVEYTIAIFFCGGGGGGGSNKIALKI